MAALVHSGHCSTVRSIIALDVDYFYCQVELRKRPNIDRNHPVAAFQRNLVVTCNYPARAAGVKKLMLVKDARDVCPGLILLDASDLQDYRVACSEIICLLKDMLGGAAVENLGLDEFFIDVTEIVCRRKEYYSCTTSFKGYCWPSKDCDSYNLLENEELRNFVVASHLCLEIREAIKSKLQLTCSGGISNSKLLSKLAAGLHKPDEQTIILPHLVESYLNNLDLRKLPGIGSVTYQSLVDHFCVSTCEQLRFVPVERLVEAFGKRTGIRLYHICRGIDEESVRDTSLVKSISCEERFAKTECWSEILRYLRIVVERLLDRLVEHARVSSGRYGRLLVVTYLKTLSTKRESISCNVPFDVIRLCSLCNSLKSSSSECFEKFSNLYRSTLKQLENRCIQLLRIRLGSDFSLCLVSVGVKNFVTLKEVDQTSHPNSIISLIQRSEAKSTFSSVVGQTSSREPMKCCICNAFLNMEMSNEDINRHIDKCLCMESHDKSMNKNVLDGFIKSKKPKVSLTSSQCSIGT
ncbi:hypothetical protein GpartN1_g5065.t1 [Galdieria partita]|uniref:UmuC domain-containing protein n=1 Tax=Galdieria partita TaxID=83374 RepID=A0A9C7PZ77_9RHOD|nr:hypothetical protein GpartN1_g5065.t1 [Galdieria partita]